MQANAVDSITIPSDMHVDSDMEEASSENSTPTTSQFTFAAAATTPSNKNTTTTTAAIEPVNTMSQSLPNYNMGSNVFPATGSRPNSYTVDDPGYFFSSDGLHHSMSHGSPGGSSIGSTPGDPTFSNQSPSYNMGAMSFEDLFAMYYANGNGNNSGNEINNSMLAMMGSVTHSQPQSGTSHVTPSQLMSQQPLSTSKPSPIKFGSLEEKLKSQVHISQPSGTTVKLEGKQITNHTKSVKVDLAGLRELMSAVIRRQLQV